MADFQTINAGRAGAGTAMIDEGLRAHMNKVYGLMSIGMVVTGLVAWSIGTNDALMQAIWGSGLRWIAIFAPLAVVFAFGAFLNRMSVATAQLVFYAYAALMGLSISTIMVRYTGVSIAQTFLVTAIAFASLSLYGYTTKRNLSAFGSFLMMGLIGIIVASIVNMFLASSALAFAISVIGVLLFAGLTAYDTQQIKEMYYVGDDGTVAGRKAVMGALRLYLDFINLFMMLLQLFGDRR